METVTAKTASVSLRTYQPLYMSFSDTDLMWFLNANYNADIEDFISEGSDFYLAFFNNLQIRPSLTQADIRVRVTNMDQISQNVQVSYKSDVDDMMRVDPGRSVDFKIPVDLRLQDIGEMDKGVFIQSSNGSKLSMTALGDELTSSDTYQLLPCVYLPSMYEYYAVSVAKEDIVVVVDGEEIQPDPLGSSVLVVVSSVDDTQVTITPTQNVSIIPETEIEVGTSVNITLDKRNTLFISSTQDLTGTHILCDKPVAVFSGHECGNMPANVSFCDHMVEQIPPTSTWGREFYTISFQSRIRDSFKAISSTGNNTIRWICNDPNGTLVSSERMDFPAAGVAVEFDIPSNRFCRFTSNYPVLLVQFSIGGDADNIIDADPFMTIIPPVGQYRSLYMLNYFSGSRITNYLNIVLLNTAGVATSDTLLNGESIANTWTEIQCDGESNDICAHGVQIEGLDSGTISLSHSHPDAQLVGISYSLGLRTGRGSFSGMTQKPIACKYVCNCLQVHALCAAL